MDCTNVKAEELNQILTTLERANLTFEVENTDGVIKELNIYTEYGRHLLRIQASIYGNTLEFARAKTDPYYKVTVTSKKANLSIVEYYTTEESAGARLEELQTFFFEAHDHEVVTDVEEITTAPPRDQVFGPGARR